MPRKRITLVTENSALDRAAAQRAAEHPDKHGYLEVQFELIDGSGYMQVAETVDVLRAHRRIHGGGRIVPRFIER